MATITTIPWLRHLRTESSSWVRHTRSGSPVRTGRGLAFWFSPLSASIAEIPADDRELPILFHGRSADYQDVAVQAVLTWRVADPETLADRVDFSIDIGTGAWLHEPLEQVAQVLTQLAQQLAWGQLAAHDVRTLLREGVDGVRAAVAEGLSQDPVITQLGLAIVSVRIASIRPTTDVERALELPAREAIQQRADEATFSRRALAVEKERAIAENELANRVELARRTQELIAQEGANAQREAEDRAAAARVQAESRAERKHIADSAEAEGIAQIEAARNAAEKERLRTYRDLSPELLLGLAARELASNLPPIEHLTLGPDSFGPALQRLLVAGGDALQR